MKTVVNISWLDLCLDKRYFNQMGYPYFTEDTSLFSVIDYVRISYYVGSVQYAVRYY